MPRAASMCLLAHLLVALCMMSGEAAARNAAGSRTLQQTARVTCQSGLFALADNTCGCTPGMYWTGSGCAQCVQNNFCPGGLVDVANSANTVAISYNCETTFTAGLQTLGRRATSLRACVNQPGYYYAFNSTSNTPSAVACPANTYGPGRRKQRSCVPCPTGYTTGGQGQKTKVSECLVPAGFFLRGPGLVAPCPIGTYRSGDIAADGNAAVCQSCGAGNTTNTVGSTSAAACVVASTNGTQKDLCPQNYYCVDGTAANKTACPHGLKTMAPGAISIDQCMTPPGYETKFNGQSDQVSTTKCKDGYRANWVRPVGRTDVLCTPCGTNVEAQENDQISLEANSWTTVATSSSACYIKRGMGLYYLPLTREFRAVSCNASNYGVAEDTFGLDPNPCRDCPAGLTTTTSASSPSSSYFHQPSLGFYDSRACVTRPGYGFSMTGRGGELCRAGYGSTPYSYQPCQVIACDTGYQPAGNSTGDCLVIPGWGTTNNASFGLCPAGTYSAGGTEGPQDCSPCPTGKTTSSLGATSSSDCDLCAGGYGGSDCATQCGGGTGANATYGLPGIAPAECAACPTSTTPFFFSYSGTLLAYTPLPLTRAGADKAGDCLTEFVQVEENSWLLAGANTSAPAATTLDECIDACRTAANNACMYLSFAYTNATNGNCNLRLATGTGGNTTTLSFKAGSYDSLGGSKLTRANALNSGFFTHWKGEASSGIGVAGDSTSGGTVNDCLVQCALSSTCTAVAMTASAAITSGSDTLTTCQNIVGAPSTNTRSLTRAVASKLLF